MLSRIEKTRDFWFLVITSCFFFLLRLPSLFEPYWYGDEGIYEVLGASMNNGRLLYRDIWDNKPPILYAIYALFGGDQFAVRLLSLVFGLASVIVFFLLAKKLFGQTRSVFIATCLFAFLFAIPLLEGNIANAENFMALPILISALFLASHASRQESLLTLSRNTLLKIGVLLSLAFLIKIVAIFDAAAFVCFFLIATFPHVLKMSELKKLTPFVIGFFGPILLTTFYFLVNGAFWDFFTAAFAQNIGYVSYGNQFLFPQGLLVLKLGILALFLFFLFLKRHHLSKATLFIIVWLAFSLFNAFFSHRPYTHYLLVLLPSFSLLVGLIFWDKKWQKVTISLTVITVFVVLTNFSLSGKTMFYYQNFLSFLFHQKSVNEYQAFFDRRTPTDYTLSSFIKTHAGKDDQLFIWGNNAQVYVLSNKLPPGRYTVAYHMTATPQSIKETETTVLRVKPKFIIVTDMSRPLPFPLAQYEQKLMLNKSIIYERIF